MMITPAGSQKPDEKYVETEIILERRRSKRFKAETEENITVINEDITTINEVLDEIPNIYVKSVPIREIVVLERAVWEDITEPDETILYCVYDA